MNNAEQRTTDGRTLGEACRDGEAAALPPVRLEPLLAAVLHACVKVKAESDAIRGHMGAAVQSDVCHVVIKIVEEARRQIAANTNMRLEERSAAE